MNTLKLEGQKDNIRVNALAPVAATRMTENLMPPQALEALKPEYLTLEVTYLVSEDAPTGVILAAVRRLFPHALASKQRRSGQDPVATTVFCVAQRRVRAHE